MKKVYVLLSLLGTSILLQAQINLDYLEEKKKKKLEPRLSICGALNLSSIGGESDSYKGVRAGGQVGVGTPVVKLSSNTAVFVEALYSMQGSEYEESGYTEPGGGGGSYGSGTVKLDYINMPIVARYQNPGGFYAEAGLQPGLLVSAKDKIAGNTYDIKDNVNKFDLGVVAGVGYQFNNNIGAGLRATPGITNINKKQSGYETLKDRNFVLSLAASYTF